MPTPAFPPAHSRESPGTLIDPMTEPTGAHPVSPLSTKRNAWWDWLIVASLLVGTLALYWRVRHYPFINFDDGDYVVGNIHVQSGLTLDSVLWAFTTGARSNWHPLTWLSYQLDAQLFGINAGAMHLENVAIHAINAALLYGLLAGMTGRRPAAAWVAAMFAWHPLHVESVAWISERKDVLSTLFMFLCLLAYLRYVRRPAIANYLLVVVLMALGLMAKPMLVSLPCLMLLLDIWPLRRLWEQSVAPPTLWTRTRSGAIVAEKLPLFALAAASAAVTYAVQSSGHSVASQISVPPGIRLANAIVAYAQYLRMTVAPYGLAVFYPHPASYPGGSIPQTQIVLCAILLALITTISIIAIRRLPWMLIGWLWYLGMLLPVIGLVQVGRQAMADRYTYVPLVGIFVAMAWTTIWLAKFRPRAGGAVAAVLALATLAGAVAVSWRQIGYWRDSQTLMTRAIQVVPNNYLAHASLGAALDERGLTQQAAAEYHAALAIKPDDALALYSLALQAQLRGDAQQAIELYERVISANPNYAIAYNNLGNLLVQQGQLPKAIGVYRAGIARNAEIPQLYHNLAAAQAQQGALDDAIENWKTAVSLNPRYADAEFRLGLALLTVGQESQATQHLRRAVELQPDRADLLANFAWVLATHSSSQVRNAAAAITLAEKACELTHNDNPQFLDALAAAYARAGQFDRATATAQKALALAQQQNNPQLASAIENRLALYQKAQPFTAGQ
jgi:tetratricopeptide (TPR) repeat protein